MARLASQSRSRPLVTNITNITGAHDQTEASLRADWAIPGLFWVKTDFSANLDGSTWSQKSGHISIKSAQIGYTIYHFFVIYN
jgi:hypothetical protein